MKARWQHKAFAISLAIGLLAMAVMLVARVVVGW